jgi:hypothetical protein
MKTTRMIRKAFGSFAPIAIIALGCNGATASVGWDVPHKYQSKLGSVRQVQGKNYDLRAPSGWTEAGRGGPGKTGVAFSAAPLPDKMQFFVQFMLFGNPIWKTDTQTPANYLTKRIQNNIAYQMTDFKMKAIETGMLHGMPFARTYFSGLDKTSNKKLHGFFYVGIDSYNVIEIMGTDEDTDKSNMLKVAEASALTFARNPGNTLPMR